MKIKQAIQILRSRNQPGTVVKKDLNNFKHLMDILNHPYKAMKHVHITGTNGKGSVAYKTSAMLELAGYKVGLFTSPHLYSFRQRMQINNRWADPQAIGEIIVRINQISQKHKVPASYFQILASSAFVYFKENNCDIVSLQVGMGGQKDTTNIVKPSTSVLTSIGMDHIQILGPTIEDIARNKAGIIKQGVPVVLGPTAQQKIILDIAQQKKSEVTLISSQNTYQNVDQINKDICRQIAKILNKRQNMNISEQSIEKGIMIRPPCRMERIQKNKLPKWAEQKQIYFDVGHNPDAIDEVMKYFKGKQGKITIVYGSSSNKDYQQILVKLEKYAKNMYLIEAKHDRAAPISALQSYIGQSTKPSIYRVIDEGNIQKTLAYVLSDPNADIVLVLGSFFIMPQARGFFQPELLQYKQEGLNQNYTLQK